MECADAAVGRRLLGGSVAVAAVLALWINTYPFVDQESPLFAALPDPRWFLLFCAVWGLFFIGGLMAFTLYHIYPHL